MLTHTLRPPTRTIRLALALALASACMLTSAAGRASAFSIDSFTSPPQPTAAGAHSMMESDLRFNTVDPATGNLASVQSITLKLPQGFSMNPEAIPLASRCTASQYASFSCPLSSQVAILYVSANVPGIGRIGFYGYAYEMVPIPNNLELFAIKLQPPANCTSSAVCSGTQNISLLDRVTLDGNVTPRLKETVTGLPQTITFGGTSYKFYLELWQFIRNAHTGGVNGAGKFWMTNPFACYSNSTEATVETSAGPYTASDPYTPTNCAAVVNDFRAAVTSGTTAVNTPTSATATLSIGLDSNGDPKGRPGALSHTFPLGSTFDAADLTAARICGSQSVAAGQCSETSAIGTISVGSSHFPAGYSGTAYLSGLLGSLYLYTAKLNGPAGTSLLVSGNVESRVFSGETAPRVRLTLDRVPDISLTSVTMTLSAPRYKLSGDPCLGRANVQASNLSDGQQQVLYPTYNGRACG